MIKQKIRNNKYCILSAIFTMLFLYVVFVVHEVAPFGSMMNMTTDSFHQYVPLLSQLFEKIKNGDSLIYALKTGFGTSEIGNIINYLLSPLTWLIALFGKNNLHIGFGVVVILKATLSAFTCSYFLRKKTEINNFSLVIFPMLYATSYYFLAYFWNIMWMDAVYMLPIVFYGIYQLIHEKKYTTYVIALAYTMITNYYMGFMVCIGCVIYFLYEYFTNYSIKTILEESKNPFKKFAFLNTGLRFAIMSIIAAGISCVILVPIYGILGTTSATSNPAPTGIDFYPLTAVISNHFFCNITSFHTNLTNTNVTPNVYCGLISVIAICFFFISKKISKKEKIAAISVLAFFFLSFCTNILNYIWHAGHYPNSLPYRFSYIYIFFFIYFAFIGFSKMEFASKKSIIFTTIGLIILTFVCIFSSSPNRTNLTLLGTAILFAIYGIILLCTTKAKTKIRNVILSILIILELIVPYVNNMITMPSSDLYVHTKDAEYMKEIINENGDTFYRADILKHKMSMPGVLHNYNCISTFTSISYESVAKLHLQLGANSNGLNYLHYQPQGPVYNMMMSVDYLMDNDENFELNDKEFDLVGTNKETNSNLYKTKYPTSIAFGSQVSLNEKFDSKGTSPFEIQNRFANIVTGKELNPMIHEKGVIVTGIGFDITTEETKSGYIIKYTKTSTNEDAEIKIEFTAQQDGYYYLTTQGGTSFTHKTIHQDKELIRALDIYPGSIAVGNVAINENVVTTLKPTTNTTESGELYFYIARTDENKVKSLYNAIQENGIANVLEYENDYVKFEIENTTKYVYTTIPYDSNWVIKIDGKTVANNELKTIEGAFYELELEPGKHIVEFEYKQKSMTTGLVISTISLGIFIAILVTEKKLLRKDKKEN